MSEEDYTEVTEEGWLSRIGGAIKGIAIGIVLFLIAFPLLFWNEGRAVKTAKSLAEGASSVVSIQADKVTTVNEGKLVYLTGKAETNDILKDSEFGISKKVIKLIRNVETYQWEENVKSESKKELGGKKVTTKKYSYKKVWNNNLIDSSDFKIKEGHQNPGSVVFSNATILAKEVTLGAFKLNNSLKNRIGNATSISLNLEELPAELKNRTVVENNYFVIKPKLQTTIISNEIESQSTDLMKSDLEPAIGTQRISFKLVTPSNISIIAKQIKDTFEPYTTSVGGSISILEMGTVSSKLMFEKAEAQNTTMAWILRLVGIILMFVGITLVLKPLSVIADVVPFIGSIIEFGTGIIAFIVATFFSFITIAIAWIFYKPLIGIILIILALAICAGGYFLKSKKD